MTSTVASAGPVESRDREVPLWRLNLLRAGFLILVVTGLFVHPQWIVDPSPTDRGMIQAFTGGLWLMGFLGLRYPLQMLPIAVFEFVEDAVAAPLRASAMAGRRSHSAAER